MDSQNIFTGITVISWLILLITGWMSLGVPSFSVLDIKIIVVWLMHICNEDWVFGNSFDIYYVLFYMIIIITLILASAAFLVYIYHLFINKNENIINSMLGSVSKFHFVPLICISAIFIIGESLEKRISFDDFYYGDYDDYDDYDDYSDDYNDYEDELSFITFGLFFKIKKFIALLI